MILLQRCFALLLCAAATTIHAESLETQIQELARAWDAAYFATEDDTQREKALAALAPRARALHEAWPERAEPLIWEGIVLSTWAGAKGGLGALDLVKQARERLQRAENIDPKALNGSVYTSLGSLYYQVPGWPLSFGNDDKAAAYLKKALVINPDGVDPNYFYGDYLIEEGRYQEALPVLERALQAKPRPGRELADAGRQAQVRKALAKIRAKVAAR